MSLLKHLLSAGILAASCLAVPVAAQIFDTVGFSDLQARYGGSLSTGSQVSLLFVEARSGDPSTGPYHPDPALFPGRTLIDYGGEPDTFSGHANAVLGTALGMTPALGTVGVVPAGAWLGGAGLNIGSSGSIFLLQPPPGTPSYAVVNASWAGQISLDSDVRLDALRRFDAFVAGTGITVVGAANNGVGSPPLLPSQAYNSITVGLSNGLSSDGPSTDDGAGRAVVDFVVPDTTTSGATGWGSAAALLLIDRARTDGALSDAADPRVVRSLLLTSAEKLPGWERGLPGTADDEAVPLDFQQGAGELRVNVAYDLLMAGRRGPAFAPGAMGWDLATLGPGGETVYFLEHGGGLFTATLTWNREVTGWVGEFPATVAPLADLNLSLYHALSTSSVGSLTARSASPRDNVEHLALSLPAGLYALGVTGPEGTTYALSFVAVPELPVEAAAGVLVVVLAGRWLRRMGAGRPTPRPYSPIS